MYGYIEERNKMIITQYRLDQYPPDLNLKLSEVIEECELNGIDSTIGPIVANPTGTVIHFTTESGTDSDDKSIEDILYSVFNNIIKINNK